MGYNRAPPLFLSVVGPGCVTIARAPNHAGNRPTSTSVLIRTYLGSYLEYKNNIGIVGKVKMSSSFEIELGKAEAPPKTA